MVSVVETIIFVADLLAPVGAEVFMFLLAAVVYLFMTGSIFRVQPKPKKDVGDKQASASKFPDGRQAAVQRASLALRRGRLLEALAEVEQLNQVPSTLAVSLLGSLAQAPELSDEVMDKLMDLAGSLRSPSLEAAAQEAQQLNDGPACRRLFQVAGLMSIPRTEKALELLVKGHAADPVAMRIFAEDVAAEQPSAAEKVLAIIATVKDGLDNDFGLPGRQTDLAKQAKVISGLGKQGNLEAAIRQFKKLNSTGVPLNPLVYNCMLDACVQCGDLTAALEYFASMKAQNLDDVVSYNTIMKGHLARGDLKAAADLLQQMDARGLDANRITYHALLNAVVQGGDRPAAWRLAAEMQSKGLTPNAVTCSILMKVVTSSAHSSDLARVLELVDKLEKPVDEVLFASFVEACIRTCNLDLLWERLRLYASDGAHFKLSAPTYGSMIKACGQAHNVQRSWDLWNEMIDRQVKPTAITLGCMVETLVANNCVEDAWKLAQAIWEDEEQRHSVNTVIYSTILKGFAIVKKFDQVTAVYEEMMSHGIPCNTITYNTLLNAMARCGMMDRAAKLLEDMRAVGALPDIVTYSTIVKGYCSIGDLDKSFKLLKEMMEVAHIMPDEVMYNSLLDGCAKQQRLEDALKLLDQMKAAGVAPSNYTLSILSKLLGRARRLNQASAMVESVSKEYGFRPNIQVYTCLIQACFHNRQMARALTLHDEIVREGFSQPDEKTYTVLARGCLQAGSVQKAVEVVRCAYHLPGHCLRMARGAPHGVERRCLDEVLAALGEASTEAQALATAVLAVRCGGGKEVTRQQALHGPGSRWCSRQHVGAPPGLSRPNA